MIRHSLLSQRAAIVAFAVLGACLISSGTARAQVSGSWAVDALGNYNTGTNWSPSGSIPNAGGVATFGGAISAARVVTLDITPTLSGLIFSNSNSPGAYTISATGGSVFNMQAGSTITKTGLANAINNAPVTLGGDIDFSGAGLGNLTMGGAIGGAGNISIGTTSGFTELGQVILGVSNGFVGNVRLNSGSLALGNAAALGPAASNNLIVSGGQLLTSAAGLSFANNIQLNNAGLVTAGANSITLTGIISNSAGADGVTMMPRGSVSLILQGANTYTGTTRLITNPLPNSTYGSNLTLSGASGSALLSTGFEARNGLIHLNNSTIPNSISRISAVTGTGAPIPVTVNSGLFQLSGGSSTGLFTQNAGPLTGSGYNSVIVATTSGTTEGVVLNFATIDRGASGTATYLFNGSSVNFGGTAGNGTMNITFGTAPTLSGSGVAGTPNVGIIPFAVGGTTTTSVGTGLVTYDSTNGVRLLTTNEYTSNAFVTGNNINLTAATANNANVTINSLLLSGTGLPDVSGTGTLNITSGTILSAYSNAGVPIISNNLAFGSTDAKFFVPNASSLQVAGVISGTGGLTKSGNSAGQLILANANTYTGVTTIQDGSINWIDPSSFGLDTSAIEVNARSTTSGLRFFGVNTAGVLSRDINLSNGGRMLLRNFGNQGVTVFTGEISGNGGIQADNAASTSGETLTFLAGNNTFTGPIHIITGFLAFGSDANLGNPSNNVSLNVFADQGVMMFGNWTTGRTINSQFSTLVNTNGFNATWNGSLIGSSGINKSGAGTITITGDSNSYTGTFTSREGGLTLNRAGRLTQTNSITLNNGTLSLDNTVGAVNNRLSTAATLTFGGHATFRIDSGGSDVTQQLAGITLSNAVGSAVIRLGAGGTGSVIVNVGTFTGNTANTGMMVAGDNLGGTGAGSTRLQFTTGPTLIGGAFAANQGTNQLGIVRGGFGDSTVGGAGSGLITYDNTVGGVGVRLLNPANEYAVNSQVATANTLINGATGTFAAGTINSLFISGGNTLTVASGAAVANTSGTILSTGGANVITSDGTNGGGGTMTAGANNGIIVNTVSDLTINTIINGGGGRLVKTGDGTLTLNPLNAAGAPVANTLTNANVFAGTLAVTNPSQTLGNVLGAGNLILGSGGTFKYAGTPEATTKTITLLGSGGRLDLAGSVLQTNATTAQITSEGALTLVDGTLSLGSGTAGTPNVAQPNSYVGGTNLNGGLLVLNSSDAALLGNRSINFNGGQLAPRFANRTVNVNSNLRANTSFVNNTTFLGASDTSNSGLTLAGPVRLEGSFTLTNAMTSVSASTGNLTISGSIYDNPYNSAAGITLTSTGGGQIILTNANSYRGTTTINSGIVRVNNTFGSGTGSGPVIVNAGGNLGGTGRISGNVTVFAGGTLKPGASPGVLTVGGAVTMSNGSTHGFEYTGGGALSSAPFNTGGSNTPGVGGSNLLSVIGSGSLTVNAGSILKISGDFNDFTLGSDYSFFVAQTPTPGQVNAFSFDSVNSSAFDTTSFLNFNPLSFLQWQSVGGNVYFNFTPVPEPLHVLAIGGVGAAAFGWYRKRRALKAN